MKKALRNTALLAAAALAAALPATGTAATPELRIPDFAHLRSKATETVDVTVGGFLLGLARAFSSKEDKANEPGLRLLDNIKSVKVRSYKFDADEVYSRADIDAVRKQLANPAWNPLVQIHKRDEREDVDVYICIEQNQTCGMAVIATQPREFTVVSIVGNIDIDTLAELHGEFGIPEISEKQ